MRTVLVFGTFDLFHRGHEHFLLEAKGFGDRLVVVIATDRNVQRIKSKKPAQSQEARLRRIKSLSYVDKAILGREDFDYMKTIGDEKPDIICLGYDQEPFGLEDKIAGTQITLRRCRSYEEKKYKTRILRQWLGI